MNGLWRETDPRVHGGELQALDSAFPAKCLANPSNTDFADFILAILCSYSTLA